MKRILVVGMTENPGGLEAVIKNYISQMEQVSFDFLCNTKEKVAYEDDFASKGSTFYHITARSQNPVKFRHELKSFFVNHASQYDTIWVNLNTLTNVDYLVLAKKYGIRRRIIHSHNSKHKDNILRIVLHYLNRLKIGELATDYWACEVAASKWFYPPKIENKSKIISNAILFEKFSYQQEGRQKIREGLNWSDKFIVGHVGRFHYQKNQEFIVEVFARYYQSNPEARLVFVGTGHDQIKIEQLVEDKGLKDVVCFAGIQSNIGDWLSSFDVLLFPSIYEGLSVALLEAQANGLPIIANRQVFPTSLQINDNISLFDLEEPIERWQDELAMVYRGQILRDYSNLSVKFSDAGFNIKNEAQRLQENFLKG